MHLVVQPVEALMMDIIVRSAIDIGVCQFLALIRKALLETAPVYWSK